MKGIGLINTKTPASDINMKSFYMNDKYANAFTKSLCSNTYVEWLVISNNSLTDDKLFPIVTSIPKNLLYIDISGNPSLTYKAYETLCNCIGQDNQLLSIGMEENECGDEVVRLMCDVIGNH